MPVNRKLNRPTAPGDGPHLTDSSSDIEIRPNDSGWQLHVTQFFPLPRHEVFDFFANAENLEAITPPWLHFQILTPTPIQIQQGTLIDYKLRLRMIPIRWRTEIAVWDPPCRFVDRQLRGPYRKWIHEHTFEQTENGTWMTDRVDYTVPGGVLVHTLAVRRDLLKIFEYRRRLLAEQLPESLAHTLP